MPLDAGEACLDLDLDCRWRWDRKHDFVARRRELEHLNRYDGMISQGASDAIGREQTSEFVGEAMSNVSLQPSVSQ